MDEIIEIGNDGTFEIPSPTRIPITYHNSDDEEDLSKNQKETGDSLNLKIPESADFYLKNMTEEIQPGNFKILESLSSDLIIVLLKLNVNETTINCKLFKTHIEISTSLNRILSVDIPTCNIHSATSATYNDVVLVQFNKL